MRKSKYGKNSIWMKWDNLIRNTKKTKPSCDANGNVCWGLDKNAGKKIIQTVKKKSKDKKSIV